MARTSREIAERILSHANLIDVLINQFEKVGITGDRKSNVSILHLVSLKWTASLLGAFSRIQKANVYILKLFRILCSYGERFIDNLRGRGLKSVLKTAIFVQESSITVSKFLQKKVPTTEIILYIHFNTNGPFLPKVETVKIQIEAVRCSRVIIATTKSDELME